jgi:hypothetical protein
MARPLRISYPGAIYVAWINGVDNTEIYRDDEDRRRFRRLLGGAALRYGWRVHRVHTEPTTYTVIVETPRANISAGMQWLNGVYAQGFNRRHGRSGHLFGDRFKSILIRSFQQLNQLRAAFDRLAPRATTTPQRPPTDRVLVATALALVALAIASGRPRAP